jgi:chromosome segregation ATPase
VRRLTKRTKPLSVIEAKQEADKLKNLAISAQAKIDILKKEKQQIEKEITSLLLKKQEEKEQAEKVTRSLKNKKDKQEKLDQEITKNTIICNELEELIEDAKISLKSCVDNKTVFLQQATQEAKDINFSLDLERAKLEKTIKELEEKKGLQKEVIDFLKTEKSKKDKELLELKKEIRTTEEQYKVRKNRLDEISLEIEKAQETLGKTIIIIDSSQKKKEEAEEVERNLNDLKNKVAEEHKKLGSFSDEMNKKIEAFKKLERGIEQKTLRLQAVMDEKGIQKYLQEHNLI